jgi:1-pyrroline-5-carboxylate dehydrogenase
MLEHVNKLLQIPGSKLLFGGEPLKNHSIPPIYGALKPTAVYVPLEEIMKDNNYELVTREIFGPFQVKKRKTLLTLFFNSVLPNFILHF